MKNLINTVKFFVLLTLTIGCLSGYGYAQATQEGEEYAECMAMHAKGEEQLAVAQEKWDALTDEQKAELPEIPAELEKNRALSAEILKGCNKLKELDEAEVTLEDVVAVGVGQFLNGALGDVEPKAESKGEGEEEKESKEEVTYTFNKEDMELGRQLSNALKAGSYEGKCLLITVISHNKSYDRDLAATVEGDLGDGAILLRKNVLNESGVVSFKAGPDSVITLQEDNSNWMFTSMAEKASGEGIEDFTKNAANEGFLVTYQNNVPCLGRSRSADLTKVAEEHVKQLQARRDRMVAISKR
jgi:hypothetical protein